MVFQPGNSPILIFCDGACSGNPGPGGWGALVRFPSGEILELGAFQERTTNNQMELKAATEALKAVSSEVGRVQLYTDSTYVIRGITQWIQSWKKRGWKTADGNAVLNQEYWEELDQAVEKRGKENAVTWHYVRGHQGIPGNERVDQIAVAFSQRKAIPLYKGEEKDYPIALNQVPEDTLLPDFKSQKKNPSNAFSYLSLVNGKVERHTNWKECEARVKGVSSAKFRKAKDEAEENAILQAWNIGPN